MHRQSNDSLQMILDQMNKRFDHIDKRLEQVEYHIDLVHRRIDYTNKRIDRLTEKMSERFDQVDQRIDQVEKRIDQVEKRIDQVEIRNKKEMTEIKTLVGKQNTANNLKFRTISSTIDQLHIKMRPYVSQGSLIIELGINNAVRDYYLNNNVTGQITNIKPEVIRILNRATQQNRSDLLVFYPNTTNFIETNALTEFDGLFRFEIGNRRELIIVESKMIFTEEHVVHKYKIFEKFKAMLASPSTEFADSDYYQAVLDSFGNYDHVTMVFGALHWEIDLNELYLDDDQVVYDPDHSIYGPPVNKPKQTTYRPDYQASKVVKMICSPEYKFVVNTMYGFTVYRDVNCMSGGENTSDGENTI